MVKKSDKVNWLYRISSNSLYTILFLTFLSFIAYGNTLVNGFVWDDTAIVVDNKAIRSLDFSNIKDFFTSSEVYNTAKGAIYRPILILSYAVDYKFFGLNPFGYHLINIILHNLNSILLYLTVSLILRDRLIAFITAAIFAVHPIHTESVSWIKDRDDLLALLFFLLAFYFYIKAKEEKIIYILSFFFYPLALLSKEMAITLPFILIFHDLCFSPDRVKKPKEWLSYLPFFLISGVYLAVRTFVLEQVGQGNYIGGNFAAAMLTMTRGIVYYLRLLALPYNLCADYMAFPISRTFDFQVIISMVILVTIFTIALITYRYSSVITLSVLWFFVTLLPVSNIIPMAITIAERFLYIPSIGFCLFLGIWLKKIEEYRPLTKNVIPLFLITLITIYSIGTIDRNKVWKDNYTFFTDMLKKYPNNSTAHLNIGNIYMQKEDWSNALSEYNKALTINPYDIAAYNAVGFVYEKQGRLEEAREIYEKALGINPDTAQLLATHKFEYESVLVSLGRVYRKQGFLDTAIAKYKEAIRINQNYSNAHNELGGVYGMMGRYKEAINEFQEALRIDPANTSARYNLGFAYIKMGDCTAASAELKILLSLASEDVQAKELLRACTEFN